jgi:hypothetical protein
MIPKISRLCVILKVIDNAIVNLSSLKIASNNILTESLKLECTRLIDNNDKYSQIYKHAYSLLEYFFKHQLILSSYKFDPSQSMQEIIEINIININ